jgi:hypothetical protein
MTVQPRIRDIQDSFGTCLRLIVASHPSGAVVTIERRDLPKSPSVMLSAYGTEILTAFIMSARLSLPESMPDEAADGPFPASFRLSCGQRAAIVVEQEDANEQVEISANLWDRLYAELCLVTAHAHEIVRRTSATVH